MDNKIWDIIAARIHGENLNQEEEQELRKWLQERDEHVRIFRNLQDVYTEVGICCRKSEIDIEQAFQKNQKILSRGNSQKRKRIFRHWGIAASLILLMGVTGALYVTLSDNEPETEMAREEQIHFGSPKAVLTLASGETVALGEKGHQVFYGETGVILDTNNVLEYKSADSVSLDEARLNMLDIPRGGEYQLVLEDGTRVWLNSDTRLRFPAAFGKKERRIYLEGEAYFDVKKETDRPFVVTISDINITVLGTQFNVSSLGEEKGVYTTLVKGSVKVEKENHSSILQPDEQAFCGADRKDIVIRKVNTRLYASWKDGYYAFERQSLGDIMNTLARWYDIQVAFTNQKVRDLRFSGRLRRYENIDNLLELIKLTNDVDFEIEGKTITVINK